MLTFTEVNSKYDYASGGAQRYESTPFAGEWQRVSLDVAVHENVDRVQIQFEIEPRGGVYMSGASWRIVE